MSERYRGARWAKSLAEDVVGEARSDDPGLEEMAHFLRRLGKDHPDKVSVRVIGKSVGGNDIFLATVTDKETPCEDKQIALFLGSEHGNERSAAVSLLKVLEWLVSPGAAEVRRLQEVLIVPCVNPDGYDTLHQDNMNGVNLYADYSLTGEPTQPESHAVWKVMEKCRPEVVGSCHGAWRKVQYAAFENCQGSYGTSRYDRTHARLFAEEVNRACEAAGYPQDRMEEDAERILSWLPGFENHSFRSAEGVTPGVYAYNRFHSLVFSMEIMHEESGLVKIRKILELGNQPWRYERLPGYPVRIISPPEPFSIVAYGATASERRKSRIELWRSNDTITCFSLPHIGDRGFVGLGFSVLPEDNEFTAQYVSEVLDHFASDPNIEVEPLRVAFGYRLKAWWAKHSERPSANPVRISEVENGVSLRLRLLPESRIRRVLVNGREAEPSEREGYETWTPENSYMFLQINIPAGKSIAAPDGRLRRAICTVEFEPGRIGRTGVPQ